MEVENHVVAVLSVKTVCTEEEAVGFIVLLQRWFSVQTPSEVCLFWSTVSSSWVPNTRRTWTY